MSTSGLQAADMTGVQPAASVYAPRTRLSVIVPILIAHTALFALVAVTRSGPATAPHGTASLATFDVSMPIAPPARPKPVKVPATVAPPLVELPAPEPLPSMVMPAAVATELEAVPAGGCDLTDVVQLALRESPAAHAAIEALPVQDRSVANAVMVWDGGWIQMGSPASRDALVQLRQIVAETIATATAECRSQLQAGPRLLAIPGQPDVTLALGSGRWRWDDLAKTEIAHVNSLEPQSLKALR
jgi:hypothetical protein